MRGARQEHGRSMARHGRNTPGAWQEHGRNMAGACQERGRSKAGARHEHDMRMAQAW